MIDFLLFYVFSHLALRMLQQVFMIINGRDWREVCAKHNNRTKIPAAQFVVTCDIITAVVLIQESSCIKLILIGTP
jgi:hypothetical protein